MVRNDSFWGTEEDLDETLSDVMGMNMTLEHGRTRPLDSDSPTCIKGLAPSDTYYAKGGIAQLRLEPDIEDIL